MVRKDGAETRKERITHIAQSIQADLFKNKDSGGIPYSKTVSKLALDTGLSKPKVIEYLELLQEAEQFEINIEEDTIKKIQV